MQTIETVNSTCAPRPGNGRTAWRTVPRALIPLMFVLSASCAGDPTQPTGQTSQPPGDQLPAPPFPALSRPGVIYLGDPKIYDVFAGSLGPRIASRFVFFEDSTFSLQFTSARNPFFEYTGRFNRADSVIALGWYEVGLAGPWEAIGRLAGDTMRVSYNDVMHFSDFLDGVYVRVP
jgi:hypothetical protein